MPFSLHVYTYIYMYRYVHLYVYIYIYTYMYIHWHFCCYCYCYCYCMCYCYHTKPKTHSCLLRQDSRVYKATLLSDTNLSARLRPSKLSMMSDGLLEVFRFEVTLETQYQQLQ